MNETDQILIHISQAKNFFDHVVTPTLEKFKPIPKQDVGGRKKFLLQIARDNSHNSLCYDIRSSFAITIGASFERQLRLWIMSSKRMSKSSAEKSSFNKLIETAIGESTSNLGKILYIDDIHELWSIVNVIRHGDGNSATKLMEFNPELWSHVDAILKDKYIEHGLVVYKMRISDQDIFRYHKAVEEFWKYLLQINKNKSKINI